MDIIITIIAVLLSWYVRHMCSSFLRSRLTLSFHTVRLPDACTLHHSLQSLHFHRVPEALKLVSAQIVA